MADNSNEFEQAGKTVQTNFFSEFIDFLKHNKKWWLLPIILVLVLLGLLIILSASPAAPFIYTLF